MPLPEEENFPRGGTIVRKRAAPENDNLFNTNKKISKPKKAKKSKQKEQKQMSEDVFQSVLNIRGTLTYSKLQTGMVILGCVRHITNFALEVELPGLCSTSVNITEISDPFTKHLNKQLEHNDPEADSILSKMFTIGEYLLVKITNIEVKDKGSHVESTINPREIYSDHNHNSFKKEMLIWSCITSKSDHGYEMSLGIKNCRAFLPFKNTDEGNKYLIGKPLWCIVHKTDVTTSSSILRVSAKSEHIKKASFDIENLHDIIPGMKVEIVTEKITAHGIQGKFSENFISYIDENYLGKPLKKLSDYQEGKLLTAYVLFIEPVTKIAHLTLHNLDNQESPNFNVGDILQGEVFGKANRGVFFILPNKQRGFATYKRLINTVGKRNDANISDAINSKFSIGSRHQCRIMDYNHLSKMYICTPEFKVVREGTFTPKDLTVNQFINVSVVEVKEEGLVVSSGHVRGFVTNLHISNVEYTNAVKKRFKEGQKLDARVLSIEEDKILFTLKPTLVKNEKCLAKIEEAEIGERYPGVVAKITENGALIVFYGNAKGWLSKKGMGHETTDPTKYFFLGQVVNVYIWKVEGAHIYLSLFRPQVKSSLPNVGGRYCGIVTSVRDDGVNVQIENSKRRGFVPNVHLSSSLSLCNAVKSTFNVGDKMSDLMYVSGVKPQIFSRREAIFMKMKKVPKLEDLQVGDIVRGSYQSSSEKGIVVIPLIRDCTDPVLIPKKSILHGQAIPSFVQYQNLVTKIERIDHRGKELELSVHLDSETVESIVNLFTQYISELSFLRQYGRKQKWDVCKYSPGDQVQCTVEKIGTQGGCVVSLPNGVKGIAVPLLCPKSVKEGDSISGTVISHDFDKKFVDVCLRSDISGRINSTQDGSLRSSVTSSIVEKLLEKDDCIIVILKHPEGNKQLVYLPTKLHENDFEGCSSYYEKKKFKICICGRMKSYLIGISKKLFLKLDKSVHKNKILVSEVSPLVEKLVKTKKAKTKPLSKKVERTKNKKVKLVEEETKETKEIENLSESDSGIEQNNDVDLDSEQEEGSSIKETSSFKVPVGKSNSNSVTLPGISSFFNPAKREVEMEESSSEDEDPGPTVKKKKKLSPAERAELLRQEEERISKIEKELADSSGTPQSAEQFDRLLVANPNSSELWTKYISFHIAATEIDKARAVAKRALETINMTLQQEKFNIWIVLLNLENMFGTKESFDIILEDALKYNDSLQIYLRVIEMFAENGKYTEMEEKIKKVRHKYKQDLIMWLEVAKTYYKINKLKEARNCKDSALKSITDKKTQMNLIVRFAIMEFKYGEEDQGCAIFETILTADPKKINIWATYVDQLVKKERIDQARQVLERSISHQLPLKSMKSLFMKFRKFEESHGTPGHIEAVKQRAQEYIAKFDK